MVYLLRSDGNELRFRASGSIADYFDYPLSGSAGLGYRISTKAPVPVNVTIPGWTTTTDTYIEFASVVKNSDGHWSLTEDFWGAWVYNGRFTVELPAGQTYVARLEPEEIYYIQWAGGADYFCKSRSTCDPPRNAQVLTIPANATSATWRPVFLEGSTVTGTVSLNGEQSFDVRVNLAKASADGSDYLDWGWHSAWVEPDGRFSLGGLAPGATYTLYATSTEHVNTWLGGTVGQVPSWSSLRGAAFQAATAGGTVSGKNIALKVKSGSIQSTLPVGTSRLQARNVATGASFEDWDKAGESIKLKVDPGVYLVITDDADSLTPTHMTGSQVVAVNSGRTTTVRLPTHAYGISAKPGTTEVNVSGTARVGSTLTASAVTKGATAAASYAYYWTDGVSILGTGQTYAPKTVDSGKILYAFAVVTVAGAVDYAATKATGMVAASATGATTTPKPGGGDTSTTPPPATSSKSDPTPAPPPVIGAAVGSGGSVPRVGQVLSVPAVPAGWTATYQWLSNGKVIPGATGTTYKPTSQDAGKRIQVRITFTRPGAKDSVTTTKSVTVAKIVPTVKLKRLNSGKLRIAVKASGISKPTGKVRVKFGKITKTYRLKAKAKGKLTVIVPKKVKPGKIKVKAIYTGNTQIAKKTAKSIKVTIR
jgi:hypothetical protein